MIKVEDVKPLADRILVKPDSAEEMTQGGIIIPDTAKEKPVRGTVMQIGVKMEALTKGAKVLYGKYSGTELELESEQYLIMRESDVFAILTD